MLKEKLQVILEEALAKLEVVAEELIEAHADETVEQVLVELKAKIPGMVDDVVIDAIKGAIKPLIKAQFLKLAEQISPKV